MKKIINILFLILFASTIFAQNSSNFLDQNNYNTNFIRVHTNGEIERSPNVLKNTLNEKSSNLSLISISSSAPISSLSIVNENNSFSSLDVTWNFDQTEGTIEIPDGTYDFLCFSFNPSSQRLLLKEEIVITESETINLNFDEAINTITINSTDENNQPLSSYISSTVLTFTGPENYSSSIFSIGELSFFNINSFSSNWKLSLVSFAYEINEAQSNSKGYIVHHNPIVGLSESSYLSNQSDDYSHKRTIVPLSTDGTEYWINLLHPILSYREIGTDWILSNAGFSGGEFFSTQEHFVFDIYQTPILSPFVGISIVPRIWDKTNAAEELTPQALFYEESSHSFISWNDPGNNIGRYRSIIGDEITYRIGAIYSKFRFLNNFFGDSNISGVGQFMGQYDDLRWNDRLESQLSIFDNSNTEIYSGIVTDLNYLSSRNIPVSSGEYKIEITNTNYSIFDNTNRTQGKLKLIATFDTSNDDANPPEITTFRVEDAAGKISQNLTGTEAGTIYFGAGDFELENPETDTWSYQQINQTETTCQYKIHGTTEWTSLPTSIKLEGTQGKNPIGTLFTASTEAIDENGLIDIKIITKDHANNSTTMILEPAFSLLTPMSVKEGLNSTHITLSPNPASNQFTIVNQSNSQIKNILIYNNFGQQVVKTNTKTIDISNFPLGKYSVKIELKNGLSITKHLIKNNNH